MLSKFGNIFSHRRESAQIHIFMTVVIESNQTRAQFLLIRKDINLTLMRKVFVHERTIDKRSNTVGKSNIQPQKSNPETFKFYVGNGNNCHLVRRVLSTREHWEQSLDPQYVFLNFKWQQSDRGFKYENCTDTRLFKHVLNHYQYHSELADKEKLFRNMAEYCTYHKINVFDYLPITFALNTLESTYETDEASFLGFYFEHKPAIKAKDSPENLQNLREKTQERQSKVSLNVKKRISTHNVYERRKVLNYSKLEIPATFLAPESSYLWILKPTYYNRGTGVHVFNKLSELEGLMNRYISGSSKQSSSPQPVLRKSFRIKEPTRSSVHSTAFIIQKYLEEPLLFLGRKFDIRIWILFAQDMKVYMFKQGYVRTSSYEYAIDPNKLDDGNVHLTNNAIQKNNKDYGKYESGNQLSFKQLRKLVEDHGHDFDITLKQIKDIVKMTALSVKRKINRAERASCFEIFGYDFMLDKNCKPYLIEANTNPCIEESSPLLEQLLPRMLDDAFCLTIDKIFSTPKTSYHYVIDNESNSENLWQFLVDLKKSEL